MSTKISIEYKNREYTLEFNRKSAAAIERNGFSMDDVTNKPNVMIPMLVSGAFVMHHPEVRAQQAMEIFEYIADKNGVEDGEGFLGVLLQMYAETINTLGEENKDEQGNVATWKVVKG